MLVVRLTGIIMRMEALVQEVILVKAVIVQDTVDNPVVLDAEVEEVQEQVLITQVAQLAEEEAV